MSNDMIADSVVKIDAAMLDVVSADSATLDVKADALMQ